jgi:hypothetical protein
MTKEVRQCQNCKQDFTIDPEDFDFYRKIDVPPPTWCPECRMIRRMVWRNGRNLYKASCKAPGHAEQILSVYSSEKELVIYDQAYWWSQKHDPLIYGKVYDFSAPFFVQFAELLHKTPLPNFSNMNAVDSEYVNMTINSKNCYLVFSSTNNENCSYSEGINYCRDSLDIFSTRKSERCYWSLDCLSCFNVSFSTKAVNCSDSAFLFDCKGCSNCFGCWNLRNRQYCIFNGQYSKEDYLSKIKSFDLGSYENLKKSESAFREKTKSAIHRFADILHSNDVTGDRIESSHNCHNSFDISGNTDSKYVWQILEEGGADNYDITVAGKPTLTYEGQGAGMGQGSKFVLGSGDTSFSQYAHSCISGCSYLFGCVGLTNKRYCILNKQYTKEEYEALVPKIIEHMNQTPYVDRQGRVFKYGEFFPPELSPLAYNETLAQEYFPLTKEEALKKGYQWRDRDEKNYRITKQPEELPDRIGDVDNSITNEVIKCSTVWDQEMSGCATAFKITLAELQFYRKMNFPLPRLCPNCRHYERLQQRNPLKLWHRQCRCEKSGHQHPNRCSNEFETSYSPDRKEIIYCESCYNSEIA